MILSHSTSQDGIIQSIMDLHCNGSIQCDATYGFGGFYKNLPKPELKFDISPQVEGVVQSSSENLPVPDASLKSIMFDPPFLTYIKQGREHNSIMAKRFGGYYTYDELEDHYIHSISEFYRKLERNGVLVFKCQDIVHNHRLHPTHIKVVLWAESEGFRLTDSFVLVADRRMPVGQGRTQRHARIAHCHFLVFTKKG